MIRLKKCGCYEVSGKLSSIEDIFDKLDTIAMTSGTSVLNLTKDNGDPVGDMGKSTWANKQSTNLLECQDCGNYFLWNQHFNNYNLEDEILIKKYKAKVDKQKMQMIFRNLDQGIVPIEEIDNAVKDLGFIRRGLKKTNRYLGLKTLS